jgi:hypothetical protein
MAGGVSARLGFPPLLRDRPPAERQQWARWVLGSHSDQFFPEMLAAVNQLDLQDPIAYGHPVINPGPRREDLLVITSERGKHGLVFDQPLPCRVVLLDFTGQGFEAGCNPHGFEELSKACEGMGDAMNVIWRHLEMPPEEHYVGVLCDDVMLRSSDVYTILALARLHNLSAVQPSVALNHELSVEHGFLRQRPCVSMHRVPIVEVMAPFIRRDLWDLIMPFNNGLGSAYGIDRFAMPACAAHLNAWRFASIDLTPMTHIRRGRTIEKRYRNGLLSKEEEYLVRQRLMLAMGQPVDRQSYMPLEAASQLVRTSKQ